MRCKWSGRRGFRQSCVSGQACPPWMLFCQLFNQEIKSKEEEMRAVCDVCEAAPAQFFCAADEAALCTVCDEKVHGCNKLATRHVRLQLSEARAVPQCDICENAPAFFFCGIDGTSLCLQCDMDVHVGGKRTHERYLLLGQRVEPISKKPSIEQGVELQPFYTTKDGRRLENQLPHQSLQEKRDNSTSSANAIVVGDVDVERVSMMIDLNSQPHCMQGQTSNGIQCMRDMEIRSTSDECTGAVPHMSLKK